MIPRGEASGASRVRSALRRSEATEALLDVGPLTPFVRRVVPRTLFGRALVIVILPLVLLQATLAFVFYDRHWTAVSNSLARGFAGEVALLVNLLDAAPNEAERARVLNLFRATMDFGFELMPGRSFPVLPTPGGLILPTNAVDENLREMFAGVLRRPFALDALPERRRRVSLYVRLKDGDILRVTALRKRVDSTTTTLFMLWMLGLSALLIAASVFTLRAQLRPIRRLARAADRLGKGREVGDFRLEGAVEIRRAGTAFNRMRRRIHRHVAQRTEMLAAVSHDLRTPLTRMKLALAMCPEDDGLASDVRADVAEMEQMVGAYLAFARGEGGEAVEETDLGRLLAEVVEGARREGGAATLRADEGLVLPLRPLAVRRCFANLVGNAVRYGHRVEVRAEHAPDGAWVTIDDDGPGIPHDEREAAFRAFYRVEPSRNAVTGGTGLGLTIARDIVLGHGGDVELEDSPLGGLRVVVRLPD